VGGPAYPRWLSTDVLDQGGMFILVELSGWPLVLDSATEHYILARSSVATAFPFPVIRSYGSEMVRIRTHGSLHEHSLT
jgi:hypothetical protein